MARLLYGFAFRAPEGGPLGIQHVTCPIACLKIQCYKIIFDLRDHLGLSKIEHMQRKLRSWQNNRRIC